MDVGAAGVDVEDVIKISQSTMIIVKPSLQLAYPYSIFWKRKFPEVALELQTTRRRKILLITKKILVIIINKILLPILEIIMLNTEDTTVVIIKAEVADVIIKAEGEDVINMAIMTD